MISDQNRVVEGMTSFLGGANSSVDPALLPDTQYSWGVNIQIRDGYPKTRPGFVHVKSLPRGVIQGATYFKTGSNQDIVSLIDGRLYSLRPTRKNSSVIDVSPQGQGDVIVPRKASMTTTTSSVVVQDGFNPPMIYNGSSSYRSRQIVEDLPPTFESQATIGANNPRIRMPSTAGVVPGMLVKAERGVPEKTLVVSVDSQTELTLSKNCTLTALATLQFYAAGNLSLDVSIPIGDLVVYGNGRLWIARRNELYAGDLIGAAPGSDLLFSETQYLTGGGSFYFSNPITGLAFLPGGDTSTGQGDLIVFTKTDIHAVRSYIYDRTQWQTTSGMQRQLFFGRGAENHDSIIVTSNDIYFRSLDGIRSLSQTLATKGSFIKFTDSLEAQRVVGYDTERWLQYVPGIFFDGRYLLGAAPKIQKISDGSGGFSRDYNVVFSKILSKDFDAGIGQNEQIEAFDGEWTGLQVCKFVEGSFDGKRRCFAIVCGSDGENALYEITLDAIEDEVPGENNTISYLPISSSIEMKRFSFGDPFQIKELLRADISFSETQKPVTWSLTYAPDYYPGFLPIQTGTVNFDYETPTLTTVSPPNLSAGYKTFRTVKPTDVCVSGVSRRSSIAYLFQPKVSWVGRAKLSLFRLHALRKDSSDLGEC
jgi:hypothetical protein